jgi:S1-C subfamily serine protease
VTRARVIGVAVLALVAGAAPHRRADAGPGAAALVEKEFAAAIRRVTPATVICVAKGVTANFPGSSGVLVTRDGYVLSDGDAPLRAMTGDQKQFADEVNVRVPDLKKGTSTVYSAKVVKRSSTLDTCLMKITTPPSGGFPFVVPGTADDLRVGSITFVTGNAFGAGVEGTPTLTAGIVASLVRAASDSAEGKNLEIYSSAAVSPGVNGGPLVDVEGRLVGIVSTWIAAGENKSPYQLLSKIFPVDRLRAFYKDVPNATAIFPDPRSLPAKSKQASLLETAYSDVASGAVDKVVSLTIERGGEEGVAIALPPKVTFSRYTGPVSGVLLSGDGWIVTSLYNLTDTVSRAMRRPNKIEEGLGKIVAIRASVRGKEIPATLVAHDQRLGIALIKAETGEPETSDAWVAAPSDALAVGRTVLCVGNPFGPRSDPDPLLTVGVVSRLHPADDEEVWRGDFQTDAGGTDGNCGGALVDLRGRLLGVATLWNPLIHGRNSGIAFGIPYEHIRAALPSLKDGKSVRLFGNAVMGIGFDLTSKAPRISDVTPGKPAAGAGIQKGDVISAIDGKPVKTRREVVDEMEVRSPGDTVRLTLDRKGQSIEVEVVLVERGE